MIFLSSVVVIDGAQLEDAGVAGDAESGPEGGGGGAAAAVAVDGLGLDHPPPGHGVGEADLSAAATAAPSPNKQLIFKKSTFPNVNL